MLNVFINGKFLSQRITGVQRYAREMLLAFDALLATEFNQKICIKLIAAADADLPTLKHIELIQTASKAGHAWEQLVLPKLCRNGVLLNLSGSAPFGKIGQYATIHDAVLYEYPQAYSRKFRWWYRILFKWLALTAKRIFTVSAFSQTRLVHFLPKLSNKIRIAHNGHEHFSRMAGDERILSRHALTARPYMLLVGSRNPNKNFARLATVLQEYFASDEYCFVLAGDANPDVFNQQNLDFPENVIRVGYVSDPELKSLYTHASGFIFPSLYEGFGLPLLEAMSVGCPIACSNRASMPEVGGGAVLYFDPENTRDIALAMDKLWHDTRLRDELKEKGHIQAGLFSWQNSARSILDEIIKVERGIE